MAVSCGEVKVLVIQNLCTEGRIRVRAFRDNTSGQLLAEVSCQSADDLAEVTAEIIAAAVRHDVMAFLGFGTSQAAEKVT